MKIKIKVFLVLLTLVFFSFNSNIRRADADLKTVNQQKKELLGVYERTKKALYSSFEFKKNKVVVISSRFGKKETWDYIREGSIIKIGLLRLNIIDEKTIIGKGVAYGTYKKQ